ncbi:MAG TPA: AAA family ATPase [Candidatus Nitrosotenuis sp.]|nr:AAA family ATPase [Candidatus Nitrosotenuis sp.]
MASIQARTELPGWAQEMREIFRAGTVSQFILHGNIFDLVPYRSPQGLRFLPLRDFLAEVMFAPFDCVVYYSRGAGIKALKGKDHLLKYLKLLDEWTQTSWTGGPLPREAGQAVSMLDGFLRYSCQRTVVEDGTPRLAPLRTAVLVDFVQFLVPRADPVQISERTGEMLIRFLDWASDPGLQGAQVVTVLLCENLSDVARNLVESPYSAKVRIPLPDEAECLEFLEFLRSGPLPGMEGACQVPLPAMAQKLVGLTRVNLQHLVSLAVRNQKPLTAEYLSRLKKELIEKECYGLLEFIESRTTLEHVAGQEQAKEWLRQDARLLREGKLSSIPMGYLLTGRIGTGKTWLAHCWAGTVGVPFVAFKNFRDKWVGATEGNLEKILTVLRALGQVVVFVDEADQMTGKRGGGDSDSGLSGRIYAMLAREMSDTRNRGRIVWVFATSRPDLLEVDLKRAGRLDVHIPLFPPQTDEERRALFLAMARKVKLPLQPEELPDLPPGLDIGGNEMEALMVRALRLHDLQEGEPRPLKEILAQVIAEYRPLPHTRHLEYMDLIAVKECTDASFLPPRYRDIPPEELDRRLDQLRRELGL